MDISSSFEGVIEFVAVAEQQGFSTAARKLGCSTSHVSRQINRLEQRLGVALVARTTRSISLTTPGELYYQKCRDLVYGLQQADEQVGSEQFHLTGTLRVSAAGTFAEKFAAPALMKLAAENPELNVQISFDNRLINFVEDGFDFAIRVGRLKDSGLVARKLVNRSFMAAASPGYIERRGMPDSLEQLKAHDCVINYDLWNFEQNNELKSVRVNGKFQSNNANVLVEACVAGLGIAYLPKANFSEHINKGTLVPVLEPYWYEGISSWIVYPNRQFLPIKAKLAIEYLLSHFANWQE